MGSSVKQVSMETRMSTACRPDHTLSGVATTASDAAAFRLRSDADSGPLTLSLSKGERP